MNMTGQKLRELGELHGVSQTDVADFLGYTVHGKPNRSMISRFENEYAPINIRVSMLLDIYFSKVITKS
jgi:transcriptional regulator with XRE-family HTH domain